MKSNQWMALVCSFVVVLLVGARVAPANTPLEDLYETLVEDAASATDRMVIQSDVLTVELAAEFPRVITYQWKASKAVFHGQEEVLTEVAINGTNYVPTVECLAEGNTATYTLNLPELKVAMTLRFQVEGNVVAFDVTEIQESGDVKVLDFSIPNHALISVRDTQAGAALASNLVPKGDQEMGPLADKGIDEKPLKCTYVILSTDQLAATIYNNVLLDTERLYIQTIQAEGFKKSNVWNPVWTYRPVWDGQPVEIFQLPMCKVVINPDVNGDGKVDWQDGALGYRQVMDKPYGYEFVPDTVNSQIAMNFASWAQHPFLRVLDNAKKTYLYTDGLTQDIQFKGYQSEGHDSAHPDYGGNVNKRAGGADELNYVMRRMADFNVRPGVHINATEYHKEAHSFDYELANTNKVGWAWLDNSYYTEKRYDIVSGKLYKRIDEMAAELPDLKWVYVDVYFGTGWDAYKIVDRLNYHGWPTYTEFEGYMERGATWFHRPSKPAGLGVKGRIPRFIQNHLKDSWLHAPMLRGAFDVGFMGWHSERDVHVWLRNTYVVNLPSKYMQHFPVLRWENGAIDLEGGVTIREEGDTVKLSRNGKLLATAEYKGQKRKPQNNKLFIPWSPKEPTKVYHWNDAGGKSTWELPESWEGAATLRLYRLSGQGRTFVREIPVVEGKISLNVLPRTPYVVYNGMPPAQPEIAWGEGSVVKDPGFDSHGFTTWSRTSSTNHLNHIYIKNDDKGQTHLRVGGNGGADATVSQVLYGLESGQTYSASVWVELTGERTAAIGVRKAKLVGDMENQLPKAKWKLVSVDSDEPAEKVHGGLGKHAFDNDPSTFWHTKWSGEKTPYPHEICIDLGETVVLDRLYYLPRSDNDNGTIHDFEFYAGMDTNDWGTAVAKGAFRKGPGKQAFGVDLSSPVKARYVRLVALSQVSGEPFASIAELGLTGTIGDKVAEKIPLDVRSEVGKTNVKNYSDNCVKYLTNYQRIKVLFDVPEDATELELYLEASAGTSDSIADFDDVRVVKARRTDFGDHYFFEDFENIDEGWGPFVYGFRGNMRVHLAETHKPYTSDTLDGQYSLKSKETSAALNFRTLPALLPLAPETTYRLSFDYLCDVDGQYSVIVASDEGGKDAGVLRTALTGEKRAHQKFGATFKTGPYGDYYIGFVKNAKGDGILSIDNLTIDIVK